MTKHAQQFLMFSVVTLLGCSAARAGEQAEFKGSTSVELPKPKRTIDDDRQFNSGPERPNLEGGFAAPPIEDSPLNNKKFREEMDKKKNWIFMNPYEDHFDSKTEDFMKGEKGTGLYKNRWMDSDKERSAVQKFLEEKKQHRGQESLRNDREASPDRANAKDTFVKTREEDELKTDQTSPLSPAGKTSSDAALFRSPSSDSFFSGGIDKKLERDPFASDPFSNQKSSTLSAFDREDLKQKEMAHEREFDQILQARPGSGAGVGQLNTGLAGGGIGQLDLSVNAAGSGRRSDGYSVTPGLGSSTATFTDGGVSFGSRSDYSGRGLGDSFAGPAKAVPSFADTLPQAAPARSPSVSPTPFVLPFPQRKF